MRHQLTSASLEAEEPLLPTSESDSVLNLNTDLKNEVPERWTNTTQQDFLNYCQRFAFVGIWCLLLVVNLCFCRLFIFWSHIPKDAEVHEDAYDIFDSLNNLLLYGIALAWFVGITDYHRAYWLFHWRRWYFYVLFFAVCPIYSCIGEIGSLHHSFEDVDGWGGKMWTVFILGGIASGIIVVWHLYYVFTKLSTYGMITYFLIRMFVIVYYWVFAVLMKGTHHSDVHLHHYFWAWIIALFAEFNHPISVTLLGVMSAIFVQGIAAYGCDPLFNDETCHLMIAKEAGMCSFKSSDSFSVRMCPGKHDDVQISC